MSSPTGNTEALVRSWLSAALAGAPTLLGEPNRELLVQRLVPLVESSLRLHAQAALKPDRT